MKRVLILTALALLASPDLSRGDEAASAPRKHILSAGIGVPLGGLGARYTYRPHERGPAVSAGAGVFGYGLELGFPVHRSEPKSKELFAYVGVLRVQPLDFLKLGSDNGDRSRIWVIGLGPRLWPDRDNAVYVAGSVAWMRSDEIDGWLIVSLEAGVGF